MQWHVNLYQYYHPRSGYVKQFSFAFTPLVPRFIIGVREIYDRDTHGRLQVDTGFGASDQPVDAEDTFVSTIAFADGRWRANST